MQSLTEYIVSEGNNAAFREYIGTLINDMNDMDKLIDIICKGVESNVDAKTQENIIRYMKNAIN